MPASKMIGSVESWWKKTSKSNPLYLFLGIRLAALLEDANKTDQAISTLESLVGLKATYLKDKVHFDLGRLYLQKSDRKTAEERFNYIKENFPQSSFLPLTKIYLTGI